MPRHTSKYKLPGSRRSRRPVSRYFYGLLTLTLVVGCGWLWWRSGHPARPPGKPRPPAVSQAVVPRPGPPHAVATRPTNVAAILVRPTNAVAVAVRPTNAVPASNVWPRPVQNPFEAQVALLDHGISCGSLDGVVGSQTRAALSVFQQQAHLPVTGQLDAATRGQLVLNDAPCTTCIVTAEDLARLQPVAGTWLGKSEQTALDYENILELMAEKNFAHPNLIRRLNPGIDWTNVPAGTALTVPRAAYPDPAGKAAFVRIHLAGKTLEAFDAETNLLVHFPCSIARLVEKRPVGELHVAVIAPHPNYTFDPDVFPESPEAQQLQRKLILPPGPNNPVGVAWIGLDRPGYGIHGTPRPEDVGRTESHGCFRLANWNAEYLLRLVVVGTPVVVEE